MGPISLSLTESLGMKSVSKPKNSLESIILWSLRIVGWVNNGFCFLTVFFFEGCDIVMTPLCRGVSIYFSGWGSFSHPVKVHTIQMT